MCLFKVCVVLVLRFRVVFVRVEMAHMLRGTREVPFNATPRVVVHCTPGGKGDKPCLFSPEEVDQLIRDAETSPPRIVLQSIPPKVQGAAIAVSSVTSSAGLQSIAIAEKMDEFITLSSVFTLISFLTVVLAMVGFKATAGECIGIGVGTAIITLISFCYQNLAPLLIESTEAVQLMDSRMNAKIASDSYIMYVLAVCHFGFVLSGMFGIFFHFFMLTCIIGSMLVFNVYEKEKPSGMLIGTTDTSSHGLIVLVSLVILVVYKSTTSIFMLHTDCQEMARSPVMYGVKLVLFAIGWYGFHLVDYRILRKGLVRKGFSKGKIAYCIKLLDQCNTCSPVIYMCGILAMQVATPVKKDLSKNLSLELLLEDDPVDLTMFGCTLLIVTLSVFVAKHKQNQALCAKTMLVQQKQTNERLGLRLEPMNQEYASIQSIPKAGPVTEGLEEQRLIPDPENETVITRISAFTVASLSALWTCGESIQALEDVFFSFMHHLIGFVTSAIIPGVLYLVYLFYNTCHVLMLNAFLPTFKIAGWTTLQSLSNPLTWVTLALGFAGLLICLLSCLTIMFIRKFKWMKELIPLLPFVGRFISSEHFTGSNGIDLAVILNGSLDMYKQFPGFTQTIAQNLACSRKFEQSNLNYLCFFRNELVEQTKCANLMSTKGWNNFSHICTNETETMQILTLCDNCDHFAEEFNVQFVRMKAASDKAHSILESVLQQVLTVTCGSAISDTNVFLLCANLSNATGTNSFDKAVQIMVQTIQQPYSFNSLSFLQAAAQYSIKSNLKTALTEIDTQSAQTVLALQTKHVKARSKRAMQILSLRNAIHVRTANMIKTQLAAAINATFRKSVAALSGPPSTEQQTPTGKPDPVAEPESVSMTYEAANDNTTESVQETIHAFDSVTNEVFNGQTKEDPATNQLVDLVNTSMDNEVQSNDTPRNSVKDVFNYIHDNVVNTGWINDPYNTLVKMASHDTDSLSCETRRFIPFTIKWLTGDDTEMVQFNKENLDCNN